MISFSKPVRTKGKNRVELIMTLDEKDRNGACYLVKVFSLDNKIFEYCLYGDDGHAYYEGIADGPKDERYDLENYEDGWCDIETAPMDGTIIIGAGFYDPDKKVVMTANAMKYDRFWFRCNDGYGYTVPCYPTKWKGLDL